MGPPNPLISRVNPFPSRSINRTIVFCNALAACCLTEDNATVISPFSLALSSISARNLLREQFIYKSTRERVDSKGLYGR